MRINNLLLFLMLCINLNAEDSITASYIADEQNKSENFSTESLEKKEEVLVPEIDETKELDNRNENSILFVGFEVTGNILVEDKEIEPIFSPYYNKKISFEKLRKLILQIDEIYRSKG